MKRSRKQSASNALPETVFFVDRDLGRHFAQALSRAGVRVQQHDDHFGIETPDEVWLSAVTSREWIVLTHDAKIRYNSRVKQVVEAARARVIVVRGKAGITEMSDGFLRTLPRIERFVRKHAAPFIAMHRRNSQQPNKPGTIELWYPKK